MNMFTKKRMLKTNRALFCALLTFMVSGANADDIEIYEAIGNAQEAIGDGDFNPNILFVLDNSGSMDAFIATRIDGGATLSTEYDPDEDYGAPGEGDEFYLYVNETNFTPFGVSISAEQNVCLASINHFNANVNRPVYTDTFTRWQRRNNGTYRWDDNEFTTNDNNQVLECEADSGVHGINNASNQRFPNDSGDGNRQPIPQYQTTQDFRNGDRYPYDVTIRSDVWTLVTENYNAFLEEAAVVQNIAGQCNTNGQIITTPTSGTFQCFTRLQTMKNALTNAINGDPNDPENNGFTDVNIGLMRFNYNDRGDETTNNDTTRRHGATLIDAISNIDAESEVAGVTNREDFITKLDELDFELFTPLAESAYEAYLYFNGSDVRYSELSNAQDLNDADDNENIDVLGLTNPNSSNPRYDSPIGTNECQDNFMVLLSDGTPTRDTNANSLILNLLDDDNNCGASCLDEAARALKEDLGVNTFTIGFDIDSTILEDAANAGAPDGALPGDGYFLADDITSLQNAFTQIISNVVDVENDNFVAPAVSVSAFNRLESGSDIYYAVFAPEIFPRWNGNIKKYNIASDSTIIDQNGNNAIDPDTGFFVDDGANRAQSFWSITPDGAAVTEGGYAAELSTTRNIFASLDSDTTDITELTESNNAVTPLETFYNQMVQLDPTGALIGIDSTLPGSIGTFDNPTGSELELNLENIIRFSLGQNVEPGQITTVDSPPLASNFVGESIHSTPVVISYGSSQNQPQDIVFVATNQGMLHAINGQGGNEDPVGGEPGVIGGTERWTYIPDPSLLENLGGYFNNSLNGSSDHIYGLDGPLAVETDRDADSNLLSAQIYMGQRRGGNKYFALDVTNARQENGDTPVEKLWTIEGGTADFPRMGDTWAEPIVTNFRSCDAAGECEIIPALVLSGGYDGRPDRYDDIDADIPDLSDDVTGAVAGSNGTLGNAIYIVRADNGEVLWSTSNDAGSVDTTIPHTIVSEMDHSIPTSPTVLTDIRNDDAIDVIFAIDVAGQVFRYDFRRVVVNDIDTEVQTGGRIANLQEPNINRYFYNPLDTVLLPTTFDDAGLLTGLNRYALVTGSGYRAHPVQQEGFENRFYVIHDENTNGPLFDVNGEPEYEYVTSGAGGSITRSEIEIADIPELDVVDVTDPDSPTPLQAATTHRFGFRVPLDANGASKILNPTLIASSIVVGTSYDPDGVATSACSATPGGSSAFGISLVTGSVVELDLAKSGVSGAPVIIYVLEEVNGVEVLKPIVIIGTETFDGSTFGLDNIVVGKAIKKAWWETGRSSAN